MSLRVTGLLFMRGNKKIGEEEVDLLTIAWSDAVKKSAGSGEHGDKWRGEKSVKI